MLQSSIIRRAERLIKSDDTTTDLGILVRIVRQDIENGSIVKNNKPPVTLLEEHRFGGVFDNLKRRIIGPSKNPLVWYISELQWPLIIHKPEQSRILTFGAEGAGKSHIMGCYIALSVLDLIGVKGNAGCTAPTGDRLRTFLSVLKSVIPIDSPHTRRRGSWGTYHGFGGPGEIRFVTGLTLQMRPTHQSSAALGSPIQGSSWLFCVSDEIQDTVTERGDRDGDIEARLRTAPGGKSRRLCTATAKDSSKFRDWKSQKLKSPDWTIERMPYQANWSVWPEHWETMRRNLSEREFKRRCLAMDLPPETAVYHAWERSRNLVDVPDIGARDVTRLVMQPYGNSIEMLIGHDPGMTQDVSICLKAYQVGSEPLHRWYVIDEVTTKGTSELHAAVLIERMRSKWGIDYPGLGEPKSLIRCDPHGDSSNKTDRSVYLTFKLAGFDIRSAQYDKKGRGRGIIHREARLEMVNRLLCSAYNERRLFVAKDSTGAPCAVSLVRAFENAERDAAGKAENDRKGGLDDLSHWPAALGYALWPTEKIQRVHANTSRARNKWI